MRLVSRYPIDSVEILRNGRVAAEKKLRDFDGRLEWEEAIQVREPSWFAARCFGTHAPRYRHHGPHNTFAHTNPLFVTVAGKVQGIRFRDVDNRVLREMALVGYFGGAGPTNTSPKDQGYFVDNLVVAREYIGPAKVTR